MTYLGCDWNNFFGNKLYVNKYTSNTSNICKQNKKEKNRNKILTFDKIQCFLYKKINNL